MTLPTPVELTAFATAAAIGAGLVVWLLKDLTLAMYLGIASAALFLAAGVAHTYKQQGVDEQTAIDAPIIKQLKTDLDTEKANVATLEGALAEQSKAINDLHLAALAAQAAAAKATAAADAANRRESAARAAAQAIATGPPSPSKGEACEKADDVLRGLAAVLLRNDAGSGSASGDPESPGAGAGTVH